MYNNEKNIPMSTIIDIPDISIYERSFNKPIYIGIIGNDLSYIDSLRFGCPNIIFTISNIGRFNTLLVCDIIFICISQSEILLTSVIDQIQKHPNYPPYVIRSNIPIGTCKKFNDISSVTKGVRQATVKKSNRKK